MSTTPHKLDEPELLTAAEFARRTGWTVRTVYNKIHERSIPGLVHIGPRSPRIDWHEFLRSIEEQAP